MKVYYNEWDPFMAQWLRNLIKAGHLRGYGNAIVPQVAAVFIRACRGIMIDAEK
ncbi:MAG: hypothetical protein J3T61_01370 [Candidatus Brocadiales bacterium]|nr:hypothetical protein [Candidatus Bathyanammoxibius sp.]